MFGVFGRDSRMHREVEIQMLLIRFSFFWFIELKRWLLGLVEVRVSESGRLSYQKKKKRVKKISHYT